MYASIIILTIMLLKRFLIIIKSNKIILRRRDSIDGIRDCYFCKNDPYSIFQGLCYLACAGVCCKYGEYKRYYATKEDNINVSELPTT